MSKKCGNCAWYCHSDKKCYGTVKNVLGYAGMTPVTDVCGCWSFDGLEDWEREPNALMTMDEVPA